MDSSHPIFFRIHEKLHTHNISNAASNVLTKMNESIDFHFDYRRLGVREFVAVGV